MSTFLGTEGRLDSLTCQHREWKTRSSSARDEVLITPHIPACINTAERSKKSTFLTQRAFPGVTRGLLCPGSWVLSHGGSNLLLLCLQGLVEERWLRRHFSVEERSDGSSDAAGHSLGWKHLNGAGLALWALGTWATPIPKHRRMLRDADISPDLPGKPNGEEICCLMALVKLPLLHQQLPGSHMPIRHCRRRDATPEKYNKSA